MIHVGIVGCGHWGPNYLRVLSSLENARVRFVCDPDPSRFDGLKAHYRDVDFSTQLDGSLADEAVQAVVVASPSSTHYEVARKCLERGKHVLVEKPLALSVEHAAALVELARSKSRILMVGHTFLYNPGILKVKDLLNEGRLGKMYYLTATRTHLGLVREDVNVVWDLAPHDISILNYLIGKEPVRVTAVGACHLSKSREDVAFINLVYPDDIIAMIQVSWADSNKQRRVQVVGSRARVVFDDLNALERVKLFEKGIASSQTYFGFGEFQLMLRDGDIWSPKVDAGEPLHFQCREFLDSIREGKSPRSDGAHGLSVVRVMCAIDRSLKQHGATVDI